jgi:hypothetical protein
MNIWLHACLILLIAICVPSARLNPNHEIWGRDHPSPRAAGYVTMEADDTMTFTPASEYDNRLSQKGPCMLQ